MRQVFIEINLSRRTILLWYATKHTADSLPQIIV